MECANSHSNGDPLVDVITSARQQFGGGLVGSSSSCDSSSSSSCDSPRHSPSLTNSSSSSQTSSPSPRKQYIDDELVAMMHDHDLEDGIEFTTVNAKPTAVTHYTPSVKKQIKLDIELPLRPDQGGTDGRPIALRANVFQMKYPKNADIFHYDFDVLTQLKKDEKRDFFSTFARSNKHIFKNTGRYGFAYDGEKNIYTMKELSFDKPRFVGKVMWKGETIQASIQRVATLNTKCLEDFLKNIDTDMNPEAIDCINAFNIVLRHNPSNSHVSVRGVSGHSFFPEPDRPCLSLGGGLELWHGYHQSIRHSQMWKPILNIDVANTAFYKEQGVIDFMRECLRMRDSPRPGQLGKGDLMKLEKNLKGIKVEPTHRGTGVVRRYKVMGLSRTAASATYFEGENGRISITEYFQDKYGINLRYPFLPVVKIGGKGQMVPMELLKIAAKQRYQKKLGDQQLATLIRSAARPADERQREIEQWVHEANINNDPVANAFGLGMDHNMVKLKGRVLKAPDMEYADKQLIRPSKGAWDMSRGGYQFKKSVELQHWAIVNLDERTGHRNIKEFVYQLQNVGDNAGFGIHTPSKAYSANRASELGRILNDMIGKIPELQLVLIIIPGKNSQIYSEVKRAGDTEVGVMTQVLCSQTMGKAIKSNSTMLNLLLKINTKCGGQNVSIPSKMRSPIMNEPVIVFGADVTHPAAGEISRPSIAAIVGSMDPVPCKFQATVSVQERRLEFIADTKDMVKKLLRRFYHKNGKKPQRIVMYRDGVGEGQFKLVLAHEMKAMRDACLELEKDGSYQPGITFICVQKRHHMRLFCDDRQDMVGKSNNIPAGTVVDTNICHPSQYDFYLCSHAGIQGTSRPTHYHVLHDDNDYKSNVLQEFTYHLCHTYVRCTRSVSIPAPTYYAHLVAFRARYHMQAVMDNDSDAGSSFNGRHGQPLTKPDLHKLDKMITVHSDLSCKMYFC